MFEWSLVGITDDYWFLTESGTCRAKLNIPLLMIMGKRTKKLSWVKSARFGDASKTCESDSSFSLLCVKPCEGVVKEIILNTSFGHEGLEHHLIKVKVVGRKRVKPWIVSLFTKGYHLAHAKRAVENDAYNQEILRSPVTAFDLSVCLKFEFKVGSFLKPNIALHRYELLPQVANEDHVITALYEDEERQNCIGIVHGNMRL